MTDVSAPPMPTIETFVLGPYQTNCFIVTAPGPEGASATWIVDCGFGGGPLFSAIEAQGLRPEAILLTHAHPDHMACVDEAEARFGRLPLHLHEAERGFCSDPMLNLSAVLGVPVTCREPDHWLTDGQTLELGLTTWQVRHAPGHSPGCAIFVHEPSRQAIVGDTLFAGSIGRVDFPTSDPEAMKRSLREVLMALPDDMTIHPGHGPATTVGRERGSNPFLMNFGGW